MNSTDPDREVFHRVPTRVGEWGFETHGQGPAVMLLHGFPLSGRMWHKCLDDLSSDYHLIVPDIVGFGRSRLDVDSVSIAELAAELWEAAPLDGGGQVHLVGLSMGGYLALEAAALHPERVASLIMVDSKAEPDDSAAIKTRHRMAEMVTAKTLPGIVEAMAPKLVAPKTLQEQPEMLEHLHQMMMTTPPTTIATIQRAMANRRDFRDHVPGFGFPAHAIGGREDSITPPDQMRRFAELSGGRCEIVADAGHLPPLENPPGFNRALRSLL